MDEWEFLSQFCSVFHKNECKRVPGSLAGMRLEEAAPLCGARMSADMASRPPRWPGANAAQQRAALAEFSLTKDAAIPIVRRFGGNLAATD